MADEPSQGSEQVRAAEVIGALCLATDLGMGFPFEHGLHTTLIASRLADRLGVDPATASQAYYACLLSHAAAPPTPTSPRRSSGLRSPPISIPSCTGPSERS